MIPVKPSARILVRPQVDWEALRQELEEMGYGLEWWDSRKGTPQDFVEFAGRLCYTAFPGTKNRNVTRIRNSQEKYFANIIDQNHTSIFEHVYWVFSLRCSRVLSHELVRHRPGTSVSQESGRYNRLDLNDTEWVDVDPGYGLSDEIRGYFKGYLDGLSWEVQDLMDTIPWEDMSFKEKKAVTSWVRRFLPEGRATRLVWGANARALRHVIGMRTAPGAEIEIREMFGHVARLMADEAPLLFQDMREEVDENGVSYFVFG